MSLRVWLPLTGHLNNQGIDDITVINNGATIDNAGKLGKCYYFNGNNNYIGIPNYSSMGDTFTIAMWFNCAALGVDRGLCCNRSSAYSGFTAYIHSTGKLILDPCAASYSSATRWTTKFTASANTWYHLTIIRTLTTISYYINGEFGESKDVQYSNGYGNYFSIGSFQKSGASFGAYYYGKINDVRIYDHALSAKEVKLLSQGLVCHYPLDNNGNGGDNIIAGTSPNEVQYTYPSSSYSDKFSKTSTVVPSASQYVLSFWAKSTNSGDKVRAHWYSPNTTIGAETSQGVTRTASDGTIDFTLSDQWEKYWCVWTQSATTSAKKLIFPRMFSQASGQATGTGTVSVKCVKLEEGNHPTAWCPNSTDPLYSSLGYNSTLIYDCSGYNNHSSASTHLPTLSESPRYSVSSSFASNAYSSFDGLATSGYADSYTFAWWGRFGNCNGHMMWGFANGNRLNLYCYSNNSYWNTGNGTSNPFNVPMSPYLDSKFHHFAVTGDGTTAKLYIDGEFKANATTYQGITGTTLILNGWNSSRSYKFNGALSDFRLYATALSADDIKELYQTSASIDKDGNLYVYELKEE